MLDKFRSTNITWDKATNRIYSPVTANESDENGRKLVVQIVNGGQVEDLTGATLHLYWITRDKLHDGLDVFEAVDLKKGEFELSYTTGMLSNKGVLNANLVLVDAVGRVVSERFKITVTEGINNDSIQSENSFSSLTQALIEVGPRLNSLTAQLAERPKKDEVRLKSEKNELEDMSPTVLAAIEGGKETSFNLLSIPQDNSVNNLKVINESLSVDKIDGEFKKELKKSDGVIRKSSNLPLFGNVLNGDVSENEGYLKIGYAKTINPNLFSELQVNSYDIPLLQNEVISENVKTSHYKKYHINEALDLETANVFGTTSTNYRVHVDYRSHINIPSGINTRLLYLDNGFEARTQSEVSGLIIDYSGGHTSGRAEISVTMDTLTSLGFANDNAGAIEFVKTLRNKDIHAFIRQSHYTKQTLVPIYVETKELITINTDNVDSHISLFAESSKSVEPISVYMTDVVNNLDVARANEAVKLKVSFKENEVKEDSHLKLYINGVLTDFDFLESLGNEPIDSVEQARYSNGYLKYGYIVFLGDFTEAETKVAKLEVYNQPVEQNRTKRVNLEIKDTETFEIVTGVYRWFLNTRQGFGVKKVSYGGTTIGLDNNTIERTILVNPSGNVGISSIGKPRILILGKGYVVKQFIVEHDTNVEGLKYRNNVTIFGNGQIFTERSVIVTDSSKFSETPLRINFSNAFVDSYGQLSATLSNLEQSQSFPVSDRLLVNTIYGVQGASHSSSDGHNGMRNSYGEVVVSSSGHLMPVAVFLENEGFEIVTGDYWSILNVFNITQGTLENSELKNMNQIMANLTTELKRVNKNTIKENIGMYIENIYNELESVTTTNFRSGRILATIVMYEISGDPSYLDTIDDLFDLHYEKFAGEGVIYNRYVNGTGIEFLGREGVVLPYVLAHYNSQDDSIRIQQTTDLIHDFAKFIISAESYAGESGEVYLNYSRENDVLNAEGSALRLLKNSRELDSHPLEIPTVYNRIEAHLLSQLVHRNIAPYSSEFDIRGDYRGHYHLFTLSDYVSLGNTSNLDLTSYIDFHTLPNGEIREMTFNCQPTRRGLPHTTMYAILCALRKDDTSSIMLAKQMSDNLIRNSYPTGGRTYPMDGWSSSEEVPHNILIEIQAASEIYLDL